MADEIDMAQAINEQLLEDALASHKRSRPAGTSRTHCQDCSGPIPPERQKVAVGCTRCHSCQEEFELLNNWRN